GNPWLLLQVGTARRAAGPSVLPYLLTLRHFFFLSVPTRSFTLSLPCDQWSTGRSNSSFGLLTLPPTPRSSRRGAPSRRARGAPPLAASARRRPAAVARLRPRRRGGSAACRRRRAGRCGCPGACP